MKKRANRVLGIEKRPDNVSVVVDPVGRVSRVELTWAALTADQQARIDGHAKNRCGQV